MTKMAFCLEFEERAGPTGRVGDGRVLCRGRVLRRESVVRFKVWVLVDLESGKTGLNARSDIYLSFGFFICKMEPIICFTGL